MKRKEAFDSIYHNETWGDGVVVPISGYGSSLDNTENIRKALPNLFSLLGVTSVLDAPCGDFHWMGHMLKHMHVQYIGGDIVEELIADNQIKYTTRNTHFEVLDIVTDHLPMVDVLLCRDCLFHLPPEDIKTFFANYIASNIPYILTTTHTWSTVTHDGITYGGNTDHAEPGDFWLLNLYDGPYNLPEPLYRINDSKEWQSHKELSLWSRDQVLGSGMWLK